MGLGLLAVVRGLPLLVLWWRSADGVICGGHSAERCELCPDGNGRAWCNGECAWDSTRTDGVDDAAAGEDSRCYHPHGEEPWRNCGAGGESVNPTDPVWSRQSVAMAGAKPRVERRRRPALPTDLTQPATSIH